jgi:hypothetical protein
MKSRYGFRFIKLIGPVGPLPVEAGTIKVQLQIWTGKEWRECAKIRVERRAASG